MCDPAITCVKPAETEVLSLAGSDPSSLSGLLVPCRQHSTETITREQSNKLQFGSSSRFIRIKLRSSYTLKRNYVSTVSVQYNSLLKRVFFSLLYFKGCLQITGKSFKCLKGIEIPLPTQNPKQCILVSKIF